MRLPRADVYARACEGLHCWGKAKRDESLLWI